MFDVEREALRPPIALEPHDGRVRRVAELEVGRLELASESGNGISPGPFATEMNTALMQDPEVNQQFISKIPLGRWGKVEEVGRLALYLCSEEAGFITGTDILIDGGWCAQ